ncbi:MAG: hypothetical protein SFZ03_10835 [Candidatus Melainabacteria bacterium]|nr:hypothetical protein [Candidatus Melainabacteria bacterium]
MNRLGPPAPSSQHPSASAQLRFSALDPSTVHTGDWLSRPNHLYRANEVEDPAYHVSDTVYFQVTVPPKHDPVEDNPNYQHRWIAKGRYFNTNGEPIHHQPEDYQAFFVDPATGMDPEVSRIPEPAFAKRAQTLTPEPTEGIAPFLQHFKTAIGLLLSLGLAMGLLFGLLLRSTGNTTATTATPENPAA